MATKTIKTRILLKGDTLARWNAKQDFIPLKNEAIIVNVPTGATPGTKDGTPPLSLLKIGDGTTPLKDLKYVWANAADVPAWIKSYDNRESFIAGIDTNTTYTLSKSGPDSTTGDIVITLTPSEGAAQTITIPGSEERLKSIESRISTLEAKVKALEDKAPTWDSKVSDVSGKDAIVVSSDSSDATKKIVELKIDSANPGNVQLSQGAGGLKASVVIPDATVTGVKEGEKILSLENTLLSTTLGIQTETKEGVVYLQLIGKNNAVVAEMNASAFIKDGMLTSATYDDKTHKLTLTFNTDHPDEDGKVEVDLADLVDVYSAGNGISLSENGTFSANIDTEDFKFGEALAGGTSPIKLSDSVKSSLAKADSAVQPETLNGYKTKQSPVTATGAENKTLIISQNENGEVSAEAKDIKIDHTQVSDFDNAVDNRITVTEVTAGTGLKVTTPADAPKTRQVNIDDEVTFIFDCGDSENVLENPAN